MSDQPRSHPLSQVDVFAPGPRFGNPWPWSTKRMS